MRTVETKVFLFSELSDAAKEKARQWMRDKAEFYSEATTEDFKRVAEIMGIHRIDKIYFSGFSSQGDGACFTGRYAHNKTILTDIKNYAPIDEELYSIASRLNTAQGVHNNQLFTNISHTGHYYHAYSMCFNFEHSEDQFADIDDSVKDIIEALQDLANWLYKQLEKEYNYQISNEYIDECIEGNEYEFTADGKRFN